MTCDDKQQILCNGEFRVLHKRLDNEAAERKKQNDLINTKLDTIDSTIRGNGKVGILTRLDRLEQIQLFKSKLFWIGVGVGATVLAKIGVSLCS
jgi:hypothetical protein